MPGNSDLVTEAPGVFAASTRPLRRGGSSRRFSRPRKMAERPREQCTVNYGTPPARRDKNRRRNDYRAPRSAAGAARSTAAPKEVLGAPERAPKVREGNALGTQMSSERAENRSRERPSVVRGGVGLERGQAHARKFTVAPHFRSFRSLSLRTDQGKSTRAS
jgi:hypothetical protein